MADDVTLPGTGIIIDTADVGGGVERQRIELADMLVELRNIYNILCNPMSTDATTGRIRVTVDNFGPSVNLPAVSTISTVNTVTLVGNQTQTGGQPTNSIVLDTMLINWADTVRSRIT